jgi:anti-anti-sigma factor
VAAQLPSHFETVPHSTGGVTRLTLLGELGIESTFRLEEAVESALLGGCSVVLDLSQLDFLDSIGVRALVRLQRDHPEVSFARQLSPAARQTLDLADIGAELRWAVA